jgi:hypothetical protein
MFKKEEKKAKEFMEYKISVLYNNQFKAEFIGTLHEFNKIYGFKFYIVENTNNPIEVEYDLGNKEPFEFNKLVFEKAYESIKLRTKVSEKLEKDIRVYYPNARAISDRIENRDGTYYYVNSIYSAKPLEKEKEKTLAELDSLCYLLTFKMSEKEVIYNFYFPKETDETEYINNRFTFFEFENFRQKYLHNYHVVFKKNEKEFDKTDQKIYDNLSKEQSEKLMESIRQWIIQNGFANWEISLLTESSIDRDLEYKKFIIENLEKVKKFGFINTKTYEIKFEK